jgi:hypothetical protein
VLASHANSWEGVGSREAGVIGEQDAAADEPEKGPPLPW